MTTDTLTSPPGQITASPVVVKIPLTPDTCLSPNNVRSEKHWGPRHRATQAARTAAWAAVVAALNITERERYREGTLTLHAVIAWEKVRTPRYPNGRYRSTVDPDAAHAMLKHHIDGIADALHRDDRAITLATVHQERDEAGIGFVRVAIEQGEPS